MDPIRKEYFFSNDNDKTKLNWFCYEFAFGLYDKIKSSSNLVKFNKANNHKQLVDFCVFFSKRMKGSIFERLSGTTQAVLFYEDHVEEFYRNITTKEVRLLLTAATEAWDELTGLCISCPNRCISEMNQYCFMFDQLDEDESFA